MEHSVAAYLSRLPKKKVEQLWSEWVINKEIPENITSELVEILKSRMAECNELEEPP